MKRAFGKRISCVMFRSAVIAVSMAVATSCGSSEGTSPITEVTAIADLTTSTPVTSIETTVVTTTSIALDPSSELQTLTDVLSASSVSPIATGECNQTAALIVGGLLAFVEWDGALWREIPIDLRSNQDTPLLEIEVGDFTPNSGNQSFLIQFDGPAIGGPYFGAILSQKDCQWGLVDIVYEEGVGKVAIGLEYSPASGFTAFSSGGAEYADLQLTFDPESFAFIVGELVYADE